MPDHYDNPRENINESSIIFKSTYFTFLLILSFILIVTISIKDVHFFFDQPIEIPIIGASISLSAFFIFSPAIIILLHIQIIIILTLLKLKFSNHATPPNSNSPWLLPILPAISLHIPKDCGKLYWLIRSSSISIILLMPLAILITIEVWLLRYQSYSISLWHSFAVVLDAAIAAFSIRHLWDNHGRENIVAWIGVLLIAYFAVVDAVPIGGPRDRALASIREAFAFPTAGCPWREEARRIRAVYNDIKSANLETEMLSEEHKEIINKFVKIQGHCFRLTDASSSHGLTDRIKPRFVRLNSVDLVSDKIDGDRDDEYHRFFRRPVVRTGRNFNLATLHRVNLRFADLRWSRFRYAEISKSDLYGANLREADFTGALMGKSDLRVANAAGAIFDHAYLRKSRMTGIELQGASLNNANLDKAVLMAAKLKNAKLCRTRFKRADLTGAQLNGAIIAGTKFDHALMIGADLRGAGLGKAKECGDKQPTFAGV